MTRERKLFAVVTQSTIVARGDKFTAVFVSRKPRRHREGPQNGGRSYDLRSSTPRPAVTQPCLSSRMLPWNYCAYFFRLIKRCNGKRERKKRYTYVKTIFSLFPSPSLEIIIAYLLYFYLPIIRPMIIGGRFHAWIVRIHRNVSREMKGKKINYEFIVRKRIRAIFFFLIVRKKNF